MTLKEAKNAKKTIVENVQFYLIYVLEHKTNEGGDPAPVAYSNEEYEELLIYIQKIRSKFTDNSDPNSNVFAKCDQSSSNSSLSFSNATHILNTYKTNTGKCLSTRIARISRTTEQRNSNPTASDIDNYSRSLSHTTETSERYYVAQDLEHSVIATLRRQVSQNTVSDIYRKINL